MSSGPGHLHQPAALKRLKRRYREEVRFRAYGIAAIVFAIASLAVLLASIVGNSVSAFQKNELLVDVRLDPAVIDPSGQRDPEDIRANVSVFSDLVRDRLRERFPDAAGDRDLRRQLARMVSTLAGEDLAHETADHPETIGQMVRVHVPVSDLTDLYLKGLISKETVAPGAAAAQPSRADGQVTIRAAGGFAPVYGDMAERVRAAAKLKEDAAEASAAAIARVEERIAELNTRRAELQAADAARIAAETEDYGETGDERQIALARAAGKARATGQPDGLRAALSEELKRQAATAEKEADELLRKGESYAQKAQAALRNGEPTAETRRIQSETAFLAGDRRRVDARLLAEQEKAIATATVDRLMAVASVRLGRPIAPLAELTAASDATRKQAMIAINAAETAAAQAAVDEQEQRIAALAAEAEALKPASPTRAAALEKTAVPAAKSRMTRLVRERDARAEVAMRLVGPLVVPVIPDPATPDAQPAPTDQPQAPPLDDAAFLATEAAAQLGLDLGGPLAAAFALGEADGGAAEAQAALKALMTAHIDLDLSEARRDIERLARKRDRDAGAARDLQAQVASAGATLELDPFSPSLLVEINGGVVKALRASPDEVQGVELIPMTSEAQAAAGAWRMREIAVAEADRLVSDRQAAWANALKASGDIRQRLNLDLLTKADSTYPELAGLAAALAGSFWIMLVTLVLSLPIGVMAAIYLEEFAPRNRLTDFIEVNINNLAAVPSIVFGLLGAAVFINFFDLPRSAPVVGGLVLSLITLPTIIIATRAALGAVPPSIREGALAVGASLPQTVFHHVLPLAAPGILTGAIIGLARALGETAPLLLIGMVAFVAEPPGSMFESATALPVLVYKWSSAAERAWQPMTAAAIIVLLVFMFAMNAFAVYLRRRLERRW